MIYDYRIKRQCRYLEEYPLRLLPRLEEITGFKSDNLLILNMQYGMNYSGPGETFCWSFI
jgi:hypothetical protein